MLTFEVGLDGLAVELSGLDAIWALRRRLRVPINHVTEARVAKRTEMDRGFRLGGTYLPGRIVAGRFWDRAGGWSFWFVRKAEDVLVVELHDERYRRLVLEVDNPGRVVAEIGRAPKDEYVPASPRPPQEPHRLTG